MDTYRLGLHSSQRWMTASKMTMGLDPRLDPHLVQRILRGSRVFWRRYIRRYRAAATQPDPGSFLPPPPADNEKSRVRMVVTQSAPVAASCSAIHNKLFV